MPATTPTGGLRPPCRTNQCPGLRPDRACRSCGKTSAPLGRKFLGGAGAVWGGGGPARRGQAAHALFQVLPASTLQTVQLLHLRVPALRTFAPARLARPRPRGLVAHLSVHSRLVRRDGGDRRRHGVVVRGLLGRGVRTGERSQLAGEGAGRGRGGVQATVAKFQRDFGHLERSRPFGAREDQGNFFHFSP